MRRSILCASALMVILLPASVHAADNCKVKVGKKNGLIEVSAKNVDGATLKWGPEFGQENFSFFDPACVNGIKAKKCTLADPATLAAKTPPEQCTIYVKDVNGSCNAWTPGCTPTAAAAAAASQAANDAAAAQATADQALLDAAAAQAEADKNRSMIASLHQECVEANGLLWCYHPSECGQACDATCAALGLAPVADNATWFAAQDTAVECQAISDAFGFTQPVGFNAYTYACMEDSMGPHTSTGGLYGPLNCSFVPSCPGNHRTVMDQGGVACGSNSRRSICPCE